MVLYCPHCNRMTEHSRGRHFREAHNYLYCNECHCLNEDEYPPSPWWIGPALGVGIIFWLGCICFMKGCQ